MWPLLINYSISFSTTLCLLFLANISMLVLHFDCDHQRISCKHQHVAVVNVGMLACRKKNMPCLSLFSTFDTCKNSVDFKVRFK